MNLLTKFTYILLVCAMLLSCGALGAGAEANTTAVEGETTATPAEPTAPEVPAEPDVVGTDDFEYILNGGFATITAYHGEGNRVIIPASLDGYPVEAIGGSVFKDRTDIVKVDFEEGALHVIGDYAFMGCTALEEIMLPTSMESIGRAA
ncbi:MAG: leucine-rich repeat protein, partial [Oscillospiraceae bacterium]|nr:leucine-rich repeat protein [Oscillospiraceae bacterium]